MSEAHANLPKVDIADVATLFIPPDPDIVFEGFNAEAFKALDQLLEHPHIECYREHKSTITTSIKEPFGRYRDDLVLNVVLPNRLDLETERNVFSRLLKNDFGAGGCHHHKWLSFYRPARSRLTDIQLAHSLSPEGLRLSVYAGHQAKEAFQEARRRIQIEPTDFTNLINPLLQRKNYHLAYFHGAGSSKTLTQISDPIETFPEDLPRAKGIAIRTLISRGDVIAMQRDLMRTVFERVAGLWPIYRFLAGTIR